MRTRRQRARCMLPLRSPGVRFFVVPLAIIVAYEASFLLSRISAPPDPGRGDRATAAPPPPPPGARVRARVRSVSFINLSESSGRRRSFLESYERDPIPGVEPLRIDAVHWRSLLLAPPDPDARNATQTTTTGGGIGALRNRSQAEAEAEAVRDASNIAGEALEDLVRIACALSHIRALERIASLDGNANATGGGTEGEGWHLVCEDDATGNFTALNRLVSSYGRGGTRRRTVRAINLYSPKPSWKYGSDGSSRMRWDGVPGFGTRTTAYLATARGAKWMLKCLGGRRYYEEAAARLVASGSGRKVEKSASVRTAKGRKPFLGLPGPGRVIPIDVKIGMCPTGVLFAASYRGGQPVTGSIMPNASYRTLMKGRAYL